jgi:putative addiction module component (TIGR02574 family)
VSLSERVLDDALKLSREQRQELITLLADTLEEGSPEEIEAAWIEEAKRRLAATRSGETKLLTATEFDARIFGA